MANSKFEILEFRAVIEPELTRLYIRCGPTSDGMVGVQGWWTTTIPKDKPALDALMNAFANNSFLTEWDRGAPKDK